MPEWYLEEFKSDAVAVARRGDPTILEAATDFGSLRSVCAGSCAKPALMRALGTQ